MTPELDALIAKAEKWRAAGWFTDAEWGAVCAVLFVADMETNPLTEADKAWAVDTIVDRLAR